MKRLTYLIGLLLALSFHALKAQTDENQAPGRQVLNQIVAVVNDDVILRSELDSAVKEVSAQLKAKDTPLPSKPVLEKQVLEKLILERLQLQLAESNGIKIDDITLNKKMQEIAKENGVSLTDFRTVLEREGFNYADFRENIRHQLAIAQLRQQMVGNRISISDQEVDNLLASLKASQLGNIQYHLAHILIATPEAASEEQIQKARQRADKIVAKLRAGADFTQTAIAESDAPTALEGGDLGWRSAGQLPSLFVDPIKEMHPGDIHDPIRSPSGFHIIKLIAQRGDERHIVKQTHVRHILLKTDAVHTNEAVKARMDQLEIRLRGGEEQQHRRDRAQQHVLDLVDREDVVGEALDGRDQRHEQRREPAEEGGDAPLLLDQPMAAAAPVYPAGKHQREDDFGRRVPQRPQARGFVDVIAMGHGGSGGEQEQRGRGNPTLETHASAHRPQNR